MVVPSMDTGPDLGAWKGLIDPWAVRERSSKELRQLDLLRATLGFDRGLQDFDTGPERIRLARSSDGGRTLPEAPIVVRRPPSPLYVSRPAMAVNHQPGTACQDLVCLGWEDTSSSESPIRVSCVPT